MAPRANGALAAPLRHVHCQVLRRLGLSLPQGAVHLATGNGYLLATHQLGAVLVNITANRVAYPVDLASESLAGLAALIGLSAADVVGSDGASRHGWGLSLAGLLRSLVGGAASGGSGSGDDGGGGGAAPAVAMSQSNFAALSLGGGVVAMFESLMPVRKPPRNDLMQYSRIIFIGACQLRAYRSLGRRGVLCCRVLHARADQEGRRAARSPGRCREHPGSGVDCRVCEKKLRKNIT